MKTFCWQSCSVGVLSTDFVVTLVWRHWGLQLCFRLEGASLQEYALLRTARLLYRRGDGRLSRWEGGRTVTYVYIFPLSIMWRLSSPNFARLIFLNHLKVACVNIKSRIVSQRTQAEQLRGFSYTPSTLSASSSVNGFPVLLLSSLLHSQPETHLEMEY